MNSYKTVVTDKLTTHIFPDRDSMGRGAANDGADYIRMLLEKQEYVNIIFAAAPSQNETLAHLVASKGIDWTRVRAFHMDEYIGLPKEAPQCFGNFLERAIFSKLPFKEVYYLSQYQDAETLCREYTRLLEQFPPDIVFMGIGENAHIAFNDPHVADFQDAVKLKPVELDQTCRQQQVNDGCFASIDEVPTHAITLTIPTLTSAKRLICTVPAATKAAAAVKTMYGPISERVPATIMRRHDNATMYLDADSGVHALFPVSVITDEISQDIEIACQLADKHHLAAIEIRSVEDTAPEKLSDEQIKKILNTADKYNLRISALCSSFMKCKQGEENVAQLMDAICVAKKLGCSIVRAFSYFADANYDEEALTEKLCTYSDIAAQQGIVLAIENEPSVNAATGEKLAKLLKKVDRCNVGAMWDPGNNLYGVSEPGYPDGYRFVKDHIVHIHLKDAVRTSAETEGAPLCKGEADFVGLFQALTEDGYRGYVTVETHYKKNASIDKELMLRPGGSAFSEGGYESTDECLENLFACLHSLIRNV